MKRDFRVCGIHPAHSALGLTSIEYCFPRWVNHVKVLRSSPPPFGRKSTPAPSGPTKGSQTANFSERLAFQNRPPMLAVVQTEFRYRGRNISGAEIESVRQVIADHPGLPRTAHEY